MIAWLVWAVGLAAAFYPAFASGFSELQIHHGDPRLVHYILEHSWQWISGNPLHASFWDPPIYWPAENGSALSDVMLGAGPPYWIARAIGLESGLAMQLWMIASFSLNYLAAYLFLRSAAGTSQASSALGAYLFGFGSSRLANFNSPQLFVLYWGVFALVALVHAFRALRSAQAGNAPRLSARVWLALSALCVTLQVWSAFYPAFFLATCAIAAGAVALLVPTLRRELVTLVRAHPWTLALGSLLTVLAVVPLASAHLAVAEETGMRPWSEVRPGLPTLASWIFLGRSNLLYGSLSELDVFNFTSAPSQHSNGVGFAAGLAAIIGLALARRPLAWLVLASTCGVMLVAVSYGEFAPWQFIYEYVPGGGAVRYVARVGIYLAFPAAIGLALLLDRPALRTRPLLVALIGAACCAEQLHRLQAHPEVEYRDAVETVAARVDPSAPAFFLTTEPAPNEQPTASLFARQVRARRTHVFVMWVATAANVPTVNGFYGLDPAGWRTVDPHITTPSRRQSLETNLTRWLRDSGVDPAQVQRVSAVSSEMPWNRTSK